MLCQLTPSWPLFIFNIHASLNEVFAFSTNVNSFGILNWRYLLLFELIFVLSLFKRTAADNHFVYHGTEGPNVGL